MRVKIKLIYLAFFLLISLSYIVFAIILPEVQKELSNCGAIRFCESNAIYTCGVNDGVCPNCYKTKLCDTTSGNVCYDKDCEKPCT